MITVNVLKADIAAGTTKPADIEAMLATARLGSNVAAPLPVPFTLGYTGPFKSAGTMGGAYLYSRNGKLAPDAPEPGRAVFVVAPSHGHVNLDDIAQTSKAALASLFDLGLGKITKEGPVTIAGLRGYEVEIDAPRKSPGPPTVAYQVILATSDGGYMRMLGTANFSEGITLLPEFRKMAASFQLAP